MKKEKRIKKDEKVLRSFIHIYCKKNHSEREKSVKNGKEYCAECSELLEYALKRNDKCPLDPKPKCKDCTIHCYKPEMRQRMKEVMKFSGIYYIKRGRFDWVFHYFF